MSNVRMVHQISVPGGGVPKLPVAGKVYVSSDGMDGDDQDDKRHHGGPLQTLCLYSLEVIEALQAEGHPIKPGNAGENITISGLDWASLRPGQVLRIGEDLVAEITVPAAPCAKNAGWSSRGTTTAWTLNSTPGGIVGTRECSHRGPLRREILSISKRRSRRLRLDRPQAPSSRASRSSNVSRLTTTLAAPSLTNTTGGRLTML